MIETIISVGAIVFGILLSLSHIFQLKKILKLRSATQISKVFYGIVVCTLLFYALANFYKQDYFMFASFIIALLPATMVFILSFVYGGNPFLVRKVFQPQRTDKKKRKKNV